uniref:Uncharacterized protein n=1 Tax=Acrobeloides nanus TaxID=290746 RepID=A0A914DL80_9BILA
CLAIYDQLDNLILGDPNESKDVEEYIVFENHILSSEGIWRRMHGKLIPYWFPPSNLHSKPENDKAISVEKMKKKSLPNI